MANRSDILKEKLDEFIKKYYLNKLLQGVLLVAGSVLAYILVASLLEYIAHFGSLIRLVLFYTFILFSASILVWFILIPLSKMWKFGNVLTYKNASEMVGLHFPEIKDKLLNTLQLQEQASNKEDELLLASINQRIVNLSPYRFSTAVNLKASAKKYGKYAIIPFILFFVVLIFQSHMITNSASRIISYNQQFAKEAPFTFHLKNQELNLVKNSDLLLEIELKGKEIPSNLFIVIDGHQVKMESSDRNEFKHQLYNLTSRHTFYFTNGEFSSQPYTINVLPNPGMQSFKVNINYPAYTNRKAEVLNNVGDFVVPEGSHVEWRFSTTDAEQMVFVLGDKALPVTKSNNVFSAEAKIMKGSTYSLQLQNQYVAKKDSIKYSIQTIADRYPGIMAEQTMDSINSNIYYFYGKADDDYGLSKLNFVYKSLNGNSTLKSLPVEIGHTTDEIFSYMVNFKSLSTGDGETFEYYFEVWDNDGVNGRKSSKSQVFKAVSPSRQELRAEAESSSKSIKNKLAETMREIKTLQKKSNDLNKELLESKQLDWQQQQKLKDYLEEQKKLEKKIEDLKLENREINEKQKQNNPLDEELLQKQKELEKLFNEIMSPEMKDLLKKLEETLKQQNKEAIQQQMEKMKLSNEDMKKQLDRALEQYKQLELEKLIKEQADELKKLAEQQAELAKKTEEKAESKEELLKQQEEINKKFEALKDEMAKTEEKNKALESPMKLEDTKTSEEAIQKNLEESSESIQKKQNKKASEKQKQASEEMEEMSENMKKSLEKAQDDQEAEDYYTLRQILENLIELSVQQESVMKSLQDIRGYSPKYVELSAIQRKLKENAKIVEDSLLSLSKRQIQIKSFVNKEIGAINYNMDAAIDHFAKVQIQSGTVKQQYVMTSLNNLAVMLSESLKQMQESMNEKKSKSNAQCKNPGKKPGKPGQSGKPKMGSMKQMQDDINKQLQEMKAGKQQGKNPNSEQFARIAAQQEALRREVERLQKMLKEEGKPGALGDLEKTKKLMEQQEKDLVNKQITPETVNRMKEIETRMLEHEKAEREQDMDNQREAEQAKEIKNEMPPAIKAYLEKKAREMELLRSVPSELSPYYKDRVRQYFQKVGNL